MSLISDVFKQSFRKNQQTTVQCSTLTHYEFQWYQLTKALSQKSLRLERIYIRVYLKVDQQFVGDNEKILLVLTVNLYDSSGLRIDMETQETILTELTEQWVELDLTEATTKLWPQIKRSTEVRVTIEATADCVSRMAPPISFVNPAEIPLENTEQRESSVAAAQPLLLVLAHDDIASHTYQRSVNTKHHTEHSTDRNHRSTNNKCRIDDYPVRISDFPNILLPNILNIKKCLGSCSDDQIRQSASLATNHARIMSRTKIFQEYLPEQSLLVTTSGPASTPCCVPTAYEHPTLLLMGEGDGTIGVHFKDLVIKSCGCQ